MKRFVITSLSILLLSGFLSSCFRRHHNGNINISVSESENIYKIVADYDDRKTKTVDRYLNRRLGNSTNMSFVNTTIDGDLALDDKTWFYIKKKPGYLEIKLDKRRNSLSSYHIIKDLGEGLKDELKKD